MDWTLQSETGVNGIDKNKTLFYLRKFLCLTVGEWHKLFGNIRDETNTSK